MKILSFEGHTRVVNEKFARVYFTQSTDNWYTTNLTNNATHNYTM